MHTLIPFPADCLAPLPVRCLSRKQLSPAGCHQEGTGWLAGTTVCAASLLPSSSPQSHSDLCVLGATFDPFLGLLATFSPGDPAWTGSPSAACCLEPASGLSHKRPLQTHSFPGGRGGRKRERLLNTTSEDERRDPPHTHTCPSFECSGYPKESLSVDISILISWWGCFGGGGSICFKNQTSWGIMEPDSHTIS